MCGICGIYHYQNQVPVAAHLLTRMAEVLRHRGPDASGQLVDANFGFASRRLSIIDLDNGNQPIANEDGTISIVFNGEIYNYHELRTDLMKQGHVFKSNSDTEVIAHLFEQYGTGCFEMLNGMFAIAIWNTNNRQLIVARDRLGIKPLYYLIQDTTFYFASEIKSIIQDNRVDRELDFHSLQDYLTFLYIPAPGTIFKNIKKLKPGHFAVIDRQGFTLNRYWHFQLFEEEQKPERYYVDKLDEIFFHVIKRQTVSDVPMGAFLSGGVDSSLIVSTMARVTSAPVQTFTAGFANPGLDERTVARAMAKHVGSIHTELGINPDIVSMLPGLVWYLDEPFGDEAALPLYFLTRAMSSKVKVALSGDGADELFAGYKIYQHELLTRMVGFIPHSIRCAILSGLRQLLKLNFTPAINDYLRWVYKGFELVNTTAPTRYLDKLSIFTKELQSELVEPNEDNSSYQELLHLFQAANRENFLEQIYFSCINFNLSNRMLVKVDRASMANSLEVRVPFLDNQLIDFAARLPFSYKIQGFVTKYILKRLLADKAPARVLHHRKHGLDVPLKYWFRDNLVTYSGQVLTPAKLQQHNLLNEKVINRLLRQHQNGTFDHARRIYGLMIFQTWYDRFHNHDTEVIHETPVSPNPGASK